LEGVGQIDPSLFLAGIAEGEFELAIFIFVIDDGSFNSIARLKVGVIASFVKQLAAAHHTGHDTVDVDANFRLGSGQDGAADGIANLRDAI
jgi:hypothetical protein